MKYARHELTARRATGEPAKRSRLEYGGRKKRSRMAGELAQIAVIATLVVVR